MTPAAAGRADDVTRVSTPQPAAGMAAFARGRDVSVVGIAVTQQPNSTPGASAAATTRVGLAVGVPDGGGVLLHRYDVDLGDPAVAPHLSGVLRPGVTVVGHGLEDVLHILWQLEIPDPQCVWDVRVAAAAFLLGVHHPRYSPAADTAAAIAARGDLTAERAAATGLHALAARYGVPIAAAGPADVAATAAGVYLGQVSEAATRGVLDHLVRVEMPWVVTTARMSWHGARVDPVRSTSVAATAATHSRDLLDRLATLGLRGVGDEDLRAYFAAAELLDHFRRGDGFDFGGDRLDGAADRPEAVPLIRCLRRIQTLRANRVLTGEFTGPDGRVHPRYHVLGAHTGRLTCDSPNLPGIGRIFRPLVVPDPGNGIGEADWAQIEVGVTAAVFGDDRLIAAFNAGDVYAAAAQIVFAADLPPDAANLTPTNFRAAYPDLRERAKVAVLGLIYGLGREGLEARLGPNATAFAAAFAAAYPALHAGLAAARAQGASRGGAVSGSGLRRYRPAAGPPSRWERNWFVNFPVQAAAATLFKEAGNRLDRLYRPYDARLILPLHDAFVFEARLDLLQEVAELTHDVMGAVVREAFPALRPRVVINTEHPGCWNKDGRADSLARWAADPLFAL
ncbi:DNA polymerase [Urbifossiella limnaea]|uniref:DNA polymerase n=1 Tax=Urbifossiella limnaea TaxID=2528023 RepID=UPI00119D41F2|nr:DNA polymerase [Urbifossiella limnaea]